MRTVIREIEEDVNQEFIEYLESEDLSRHGMTAQKVNFIKRRMG